MATITDPTIITFLKFLVLAFFSLNKCKVKGIAANPVKE
jgi:hypothetical protein